MNEDSTNIEAIYKHVRELREEAKTRFWVETTLLAVGIALGVIALVHFW